MTTPTIDEMRTMFRAHTEAALKVIVEIMTTGTGAKGESVRLAAAKEILNRGWGRATSYKEKDEAKADSRPEWRSTEGKTYAQVYAEKAAEVAAEEAAKQAAVPPPDLPVSEPASSPPPRNPDPTGYIARRALFSAPAPARPNGAAPGRR